jgi:hypothetical protein
MEHRPTAAWADVITGSESPAYGMTRSGSSSATRDPFRNLHAFVIAMYATEKTYGREASMVCRQSATE